MESSIEQYVNDSDLALMELRAELMKKYKLFRIQKGVYHIRPKNLVEQTVEEAILKERRKR